MSSSNNRLRSLIAMHGRDNGSFLRSRQDPHFMARKRRRSARHERARAARKARQARGQRE